MKISLFLLLLSILSISLEAQVMEPDSIMVNQTWTDNNGSNELSVRVYAACNPDKPPFDGHESEIRVK